MKLTELFTDAKIELPDFDQFARRGMPPLKLNRLELAALANGQREQLKTPYCGLGTLLLSYKGKEGALLSLDEISIAEIWEILQIQGAMSSVSYRVASALNWPQLLAMRLEQFATHSSAEVRHLTMHPTYMIPNIQGARSESIEHTYSAARAALGMRWSQEQELFIRDIQK